MPLHTIGVDVVDKAVPLDDPTIIPVIEQTNPCYAYVANARELWYLVQLPRYKICEMGTQTEINSQNYYDYFPEERGRGYHLISKNISMNGIFNAIDDDASGYYSVNVNIPGLIGAGAMVPRMTNVAKIVTGNIVEEV